MKNIELYLKALKVCSLGGIDPCDVRGYGRLETINDLIEDTFNVRLPEITKEQADEISHQSIYSPERILKAFN